MQICCEISKRFCEHVISLDQFACFHEWNQFLLANQYFLLNVLPTGFFPIATFLGKISQNSFSIHFDLIIPFPNKGLFIKKISMGWRGQNKICFTNGLMLWYFNLTNYLKQKNIQLKTFAIILQKCSLFMHYGINANVQ